MAEYTNTERERKACIIANNALYFNDNSDYETALWDILRLFSDAEVPEDLDYIDEGEDDR